MVIYINYSQVPSNLPQPNALTRFHRVIYNVLVAGPCSVQKFTCWLERCVPRVATTLPVRVAVAMRGWILLTDD